MNKPWRIFDLWMTSGQHKPEKFMMHAMPGARVRFALISLVATSLLLSGCYSGWNRAKMNPGGNQDKSIPGEGVVRPFAFLLLEVIRPSSSPGANACGNGGSPTLVQFRQNEWNERTQALVKALSPLADQFRHTDIEIDGDNCQTMQIVESRAKTQSFAGSPLLPQASDPSGRPVVHLKVILWAGMAPWLGLRQLPNTFQREWIDWTHLAYAGFSNAQSFHQFVLPESYGGAFKNWYDALPSISRLSGTPIENIDPTDQSTAARQMVIAQDTANLVDWLRSSAVGDAPTTIPMNNPTPDPTQPTGQNSYDLGAPSRRHGVSK